MKADEPKSKKLILFWTDWFSDSTWQDHFHSNSDSWDVPLYSDDDFVALDPFNRSCRLETNRTLVQTADALVFHGRDLNVFEFANNSSNVPKRFPNQSWVYYLLESPQNSGLQMPMQWRIIDRDIDFNWTMTYRPSADVQAPYGKLVRRRNDHSGTIRGRIDKFVKSFANRPKDAVWIVSHCNASSQRDNFVRRLRRFNLTIDVWGRCSAHGKPELIWSTGPRSYIDFFSRYRFYLGLENSLCEDYVTEKAFIGMYLSLHFGLIPIFYGLAGNYEKIFPNGSYIDATAFGVSKSATQQIRVVESIATKMKQLTNDLTLLESYFDWHFDFKLAGQQKWRPSIYDEKSNLARGLNSLCRRLWMKKQETKSLNPKKSLYERLGRCFDVGGRELWSAAEWQQRYQQLQHKIT